MAFMNAPISIYDVAKAAGVSESTVSRAFSRPDLVSDKTRAKVLRVAQDMNFSISRTSKALRSHRTFRIALLQSGEVRGWFPSELFSGLNSVFRPAGYDLVVYRTDDRDKRREFFNTLPVRRNVDAVVVSSFDIDPKEISRLHTMNVPIAGIETSDHESRGMAAWTSIDNVQGMKLVVRYLTSLGHRRIVYVGHDPVTFSLPYSTMHRRQGFIAGCRQEGVEPMLLSVPFGDYRFDATFSRLMDIRELPTALCCQQDDMAIPLMVKLRSFGLRVPEDVSVTGFDDAEYAEDMGLTTIHQDPYAMGAAVARKVLAAVDGERVSEPFTLLQPKLVIRSSVVPPAGSGG